MESVQISSVAVENILLSLDEHKSPDADRIHPKISRILAPFIAEPLARLFNLSLATGQMPNDCRTPAVCPIFKKGSRKIPGNCRPVGLTPIACKTFEAISKQSIMCHLQRTEALSQSQHNFLPKKSCLTSLLTIEEKVTTIMVTRCTWFSSISSKPLILFTTVF